MVARAHQGAYPRALRVAAWVVAIGALILSLSGWFTFFGLALAVPTMMLSRAIRVRGAFITAAAAAGASAIWALIDVFVS